MIPLPTSSDGKRQLFAQLKAQAPDLLDVINTLREVFPNAKVVALTLPDGTAYGEDPPPAEKCFTVDHRFKTPAEVEAEEAIKRAMKTSQEAAKRERNRRKARR